VNGVTSTAGDREAGMPIGQSSVMTCPPAGARLIDMMPATPPTPSCNVPEPGQLIKLLLRKGLVHVCGHAGAGMAPVVRLRCREALDGLWPRRHALARLLRRPPRLLRRGELGSAPRLSLLDNATLALHQAASRAARGLLDQADAEWHDLEPAAQAAGAARTPWPPTPGMYAQAVRCAVEYATPDGELRLALMELAIAVAVPEYVALCTRVLMARQAPLPYGTAAPAEAGAAEALPASAPAGNPPPLADVQPGQWFRMVLHQQWTDAQLTWRSHNGRFFMFSSQLEGRAHSLSRPTLENLIQRGHFERRQAA
jgi:hypothetical protein